MRWRPVPAVFLAVFFAAAAAFAAPDIGLLYTADQYETLTETGRDPLLRYTAAIEENGGRRIAMGQRETPAAQQPKLADIEGLIIPGGIDVVPCYYGETPHQKLEKTDGELDQFEFRVLAHALRRNLPVLGICRGHQLMNVYFGGTLYQDIPAQYGTETIHRKGKPPMHPVRIRAGSLLRRLFAVESLAVNSYHHQAVKDLAPGFTATAHTPDGLIEAMEDTDRLLIGVQFHPEKLRTRDPRFNALFVWLMEAAEKTGIGKASGRL
jgi:putative glutamine amidotransferase